tara:strand:- start:16559 stop:17419 length:861 start_codon:yes stop_codon:yes gene_type:complete
MDFINHPFRQKQCILALAILFLSPFLVSCSQATETHSDYAGKKALFLLGEYEYGTSETLPEFAKSQLEPLGIASINVKAKSDNRESKLCHTFEGLELLDSADILVLSTRRRFPKTNELASIRRFIESGKPVIAVRTASHAFGAREKGTGYQPPAGHGSWNTFDTEVLGARYAGHYRNIEGFPPLAVEAWIEASASGHPIVQNLSFEGPILVGHKLYKYEDIDSEINVVMSARHTKKTPPHPIAWTNEQNGKLVFYMSLGSAEEMATPEIQSLLKAAVLWGLGGGAK